MLFRVGLGMAVGLKVVRHTHTHTPPIDILYVNNLPSYLQFKTSVL